MTYTDLVTKLRAARTERGLLQEALADTIGVSQAQLSRYERGEQPCPGPTLVRWAAALGIGVGLVLSTTPTSPEPA